MNVPIVRNHRGTGRQRRYAGISILQQVWDFVNPLAKKARKLPIDMLASFLLATLVPTQKSSQSLAQLDAATPGRLGAFVTDGKRVAASRPDERFSLQSVMKLVVAMAAFDAIDRGKLTLATKFTVGYKDMSMSHQPLAERVGPGKTTVVTVRELIELAVQQSDSMAADVLVDKLGGIGVVQSFLRRKGITGVRVDRTERILQCETVGVKWKPSFRIEGVYDKEVAAMSPEARTAAQKRYMADVRDTATPRGFAGLLVKLASGKLLSKISTEELLKVMEGTQTYPERLANSVPAPWKFGHKTGSSGTWNGMAVATNDVGIARDGSGRFVVMVCFLGDAKGGMDARNVVIAKVPGASGFFGS
jgi:beta-lactamase class A